MIGQSHRNLKNGKLHIWNHNPATRGAVRVVSCRDFFEPSDLDMIHNLCTSPIRGLKTAFLSFFFSRMSSSLDKYFEVYFSFQIFHLENST